MANLTWINIERVVPCTSGFKGDEGDYDVYYKSSDAELYEQFVHIDKSGQNMNKGPVENCYHAMQRAINWICSIAGVLRGDVTITYTPEWDRAYTAGGTQVASKDTVVSASPTYRIVAETTQGTNFYPEQEYTSQFAALRECINLVEGLHNPLYGYVSEAYVVPGGGDNGYWSRQAGARRNEENVWGRYVYVLEETDDVPF